MQVPNNLAIADFYATNSSTIIHLLLEVCNLQQAEAAIRGEKGKVPPGATSRQILGKSSKTKSQIHDFLIRKSPFCLSLDFLEKTSSHEKHV